MKLHEIIREKRLSKGLTQEQVATCLGVSAPAVNKWEKASSYPDITLLPALARLLQTDLNTLLSFQDDLSEKELVAFLNDLTSIAASEGIDQTFERAMLTLREYPSSDRLLLNTALTLDGLVGTTAECITNSDHQKQIEALYLRAAESQEEAIRTQAKAMLASRALNRNDWAEAEKLIAELPDETLIDKKQLQANVYIAQENWTEAARVMERKLMLGLSHVQSSLLTLMELAFKEDRIPEAEQIASIYKQTTKAFGLWNYGSYMADYQLALLQKDAATCFAVLENMLPAIVEPWTTVQSPLFFHLPQKEQEESLGARMLPKILEDLAHPDHQEYAFLREHPNFSTWITNQRVKLLGD